MVRVYNVLDRRSQAGILPRTREYRIVSPWLPWLERMTGIEPAIFGLGSRRVTNYATSARGMDILQKNRGYFDGEAFSSARNFLNHSMVLFRPSCTGTVGSQPMVSLARVISGRRRLGSSVGSAW